MNKVCLVLSLGLLMTNGQQILGKTPTALEQAQQAHEKAKREYNDAVTEFTRLKKLSWVTKDTLQAAEEDQRLKFYKYQKTEKDLANATALQVQVDASIAQHQQNQEYAKPNQAPAYDAPPSYAQATAPDLAYKVAAAHTLLDDIERTNSSIAEQFIKSRYKKYNNCWWCK